MPGFTRQIILQTLTELMNEKPLSKITVKDIVERCGVNRNTFYYHFRDIPDAVEAVVQEELNDILKNQREPESVNECMEILVNAVQKNKRAPNIGHIGIRSGSFKAVASSTSWIRLANFSAAGASFSAARTLVANHEELASKFFLSSITINTSFLIFLYILTIL